MSLEKKISQFVSVLKPKDSWQPTCEFRTEREVRIMMSDNSHFTLPYYKCQNDLRVCKAVGFKEFCAKYEHIARKVYQ